MRQKQGAWMWHGDWRRRKPERPAQAGLPGTCCAARYVVERGLTAIAVAGTMAVPGLDPNKCSRGRCHRGDGRAGRQVGADLLGVRIGRVGGDRGTLM